MFRDRRCLRVGLALLSLAACAPIASLPALSQPDPSTFQTNPVVLHSEATIAADGQILSCNPTHPVLCIYANRSWVSQLEQELWAIDNPTAPQSDLEPEAALPPQQRVTDAAHLSRRIRLLTRLKTWLDAFS